MSVFTAIFAATIIMPLRLTYRGARRSLSMAAVGPKPPPSVATFDNLLASKAGRASFTKHLMMECTRRPDLIIMLVLLISSD
jgi:hypothetical protein